MPKRFWTQSMCLLTDGHAIIESIKTCLISNNYQIAREMPAGDPWQFGEAAFVIPFLPQANGYVAVDLVQKPWPDSMGDPKSEPSVFAAWSMGFFGPFVYPSGLNRAQKNAWHWPMAKIVCPNHKGFIRLRVSYVFGAEKTIRFLPEDYDPLTELKFLSQLVLKLMAVPGVICYFNPNGEVLSDQRRFESIWKTGVQHEIAPLPLWANVRMYKINEDFLLMDTVGNQQMDVDDIEAIFPRLSYKPDDVDQHLRNITYYLLNAKPEIRSGEGFDGPGDSNLSWIVEICEDPIVHPPRKILRLCPKRDRKQIKAAIKAMARSGKTRQNKE